MARTPTASRFRSRHLPKNELACKGGAANLAGSSIRAVLTIWLKAARMNVDAKCARVVLQQLAGNTEGFLRHRDVLTQAKRICAFLRRCENRRGEVAANGPFHWW